MPRFNFDIRLDTKVLNNRYGGDVSIETIGTVEVGHQRLMEGMTCETAVYLANTVAQLAIFGTPSRTTALPSLRETSLDHVLETTAKSIMRILGGKDATLHLFYNEPHNRYIYQVVAGAIGMKFLNAHPPRKTGLGQQAIKDMRPLVVPDLAAGHAASDLETVNPPAWSRGVRMMAAFPMSIGNNYGVLYIGFADARRLAKNEYDVASRFLGRAIQGIRTSTFHRDALEENRRLANLNSIARSLVSHDTDPPLLDKIAGTTLNLLAADLVTMHEYTASNGDFLEAAIAGRCRHPDPYAIINQHHSAKSLIDTDCKGIIDQDLKNAATYRDFPDGVIEFMSSEQFVRQLGLVIRYAEEPFGIMFVYYRRHYTLSEHDKKSLEIIAAHAAIAIRIKQFFQQMCSQIGHDFNRQISRLASRVSLLTNEINKAPYVAETFWNTKAGDLLKGVVAAKENMTRFANEFQEFGKTIILKREPVDVRGLVETQISRVQWEREVEEAAQLASQSRPGRPADHSWEVAARRAAIKITHERCSEQLLIELDEIYIVRAIDAVLNNAVQALSENKTSQPHIAVVTRSETNAAGHSFAIVSVSDNGPGVGQERKKKIFQLFYTTRANEGGNGIGLANARRYVELHGGTLEEVGNYHDGAEFVFRIPMHTRATIAQKSVVYSAQG